MLDESSIHQNLDAAWMRGHKKYTYKTKLKLDKEVGGGFYLNCVPLRT